MELGQRKKAAAPTRKGTTSTSSLAVPITSSSLVDQLVERLETAIMNGELPPGHRLSEQTLAESLGVSRSPLREAIRQLEGRRLVERVPNVGARVTMAMGHDLEEVLAIRETLEALAAKLAATNISGSELDELEELLRARRERKNTNAGSYADAGDFHVRIIMASGNKKLIDMLRGDLYYLMRIHRYRASTTPERAKAAPLEHQKILAALRARDPIAAEKAMAQHLANSHANMRRELAKGD
jgi:DNA-binding GntR family transcriptional regulator